MLWLQNICWEFSSNKARWHHPDCVKFPSGGVLQSQSVEETVAPTTITSAMVKKKKHLLFSLHLVIFA